MALAEIYADQGLGSKSFELIENLINKYLSNSGHVLELLIILSNICLKTKEFETFLDFLERSQILSIVEQCSQHID